MKTEEQYECGNCYFVGPLGIHGGCGRCGSQAVLSQERVGALIQHQHEIQGILLRELCGEKLDLSNPKVIDSAGYWLERCRERRREHRRVREQPQQISMAQ